MQPKTWKTIFIHLTGSFIFLLLPIVFSPDRFSWQLFHIPPFQREFISFTLLLLSFYFIYYVAIPRYFFPKKILRFIGIILLNFSLVYGIVFWIENTFLQNFIPHIFHPQRQDAPFPFHPNNIGDFFKLGFNFSVIVIAGLLLRISIRSKTIEKEKSELELKYLKSNLNPHFLFNTLNGIYALSIEENAEKTAQSIVQLSEILRFTLTESQNDSISISQEKEYIDSYIHLQKIRCSEVTDIQYSFTYSVANISISPLILIPYLENAFKYGVNPDYASRIKISIDVDSNKLLTASIYNTKVPTLKQDTFGIGLVATSKKLAHYYPNRYNLKINNDHTFFDVLLTIQL